MCTSSSARPRPIRWKTILLPCNPVEAVCQPDGRPMQKMQTRISRHVDGVRRGVAGCAAGVPPINQVDRLLYMQLLSVCQRNPTARAILPS